MTRHHRRPMARVLLAAGLLLTVGAGATHARAGDDGYWSRGDQDDRGNGRGRHHDDDHDRARRAREAGDVLPLADVLARVRGTLEGRIIDTEFERENGIYVYEFKVVDRSGRVREYYVDAATGHLLKVEDDD